MGSVQVDLRPLARPSARFSPFRMKTASVLLVGIRGLASEVAKNIVLAGIGRLTLLDAANVTEDDLGAGYFLREEELGQNVRALLS